MAGPSLLTLRGGAGLPPRRVFLGKVASLATRVRVYAVPDGLEIDEIDYAEVSRRRVFYDDVLLVTHHRFLQPFFVIVTALGTAAFLSLGFTLRTLAGAPEVAIVFDLFSLLFAAPLVLRLILRVDGVTVYGKRTKAVMHFWFRKRRARRVFEEICARVREAQDALAAEIPPGAIHAAAAPPSAEPAEPPGNGAFPSPHTAV